MTRDHHDVDILVARDDRRAVSEHLSDRALLEVIPHPAGLVGRGNACGVDGDLDFGVALSLMTSGQREWPADALSRTHPGHPWIGMLA